MSRIEAKRQWVKDVLQGCPLSASIRQLTVDRVMTTAPTCVDLEANALELVKLFYALQFRHLLVTDAEGHLAGIVSDRDVRCFDRSVDRSESYLAGISVRELMSTDLVTAHPHTLVLETVRLLLEHGFSCLPVVQNGKPVGIITSTDLYVLLEQLLQAHGATEPAELVSAAAFVPQN
jgi:acetoin utilization protein AcuB